MKVNRTKRIFSSGNYTQEAELTDVKKITEKSSGKKSYKEAVKTEENWILMRIRTFNGES